ncbi:MAG TPA: hypothetical protein VNM92_09650 [Thermoanaerobaculia bacterium]|nr:hypothetical protein [Thermoanaerobaculia bacterium]
MKALRYVSIAFAALFVSTVSVVAQVNDTYVIPVVANTAGANNSIWTTELNVFNPQSHELKVSIVFLPQGGGAGDRFDFKVPANSNAWTMNVIDDLFDRSGLGSLLIATFPELNPSVPNDVLSRAFLVNSKTFNTASNGTFGQQAQGVWTGLEDYDSDGISAVAHGVRNFGAPGISGFRSSIGASNIGRNSVTMRVSVYDADGKTVADRIPFVIPPQGHIQDRLPVQVDRGSVEFTVDDPTRDAVVFPYVTVADNRTNGPVYLNPVLLASPKSLFFKMGGQRQIGRTIELARAREIAQSAATRRTGAVSGGGALRITSMER